MAYLERLPPFATSDEERAETDELWGSERLRLVKRWMMNIRAFLRRQDWGATAFWDELMQIRLDADSGTRNGSQREVEHETEYEPSGVSLAYN